MIIAIYVTTWLIAEPDAFLLLAAGLAGLAGYAGLRWRNHRLHRKEG